MHRGDQTLAIRALKNAAPYIRMYKGKTFVVKAGGGVFGDDATTRTLIEQIGILHYFGVRVVMVHGGGPQLTVLSEALGVPTRMVQGRRVTDEKSIDVTAMVLNGLINTRILALCRDLNVDAVGVSGVDAGLVRAHKRPPVKLDDGSNETVDYGFVGDIDSVDTTVLGKLLDNGLMPVISPLSADEHGVLLNINADTVAAALGAALGAEKLILCTGAPGILERVEDPGSLISYTDLRGLARLRAEGRMMDGMLPKATAIETALRGGVHRVHVVSYRAPEGILAEVFTNEGTGTLIVADINALTSAEQHGATAWHGADGAAGGRG
jgi:acetylglutamate kinase